MKIKNILLNDFKSFQGSHSFDFSGGRPGLHFLTGKNISEPELGANGAGKSTLWDALFWCFFGRTCRGVRGENVKAWDIPGGCSVSVYLDVNDVGHCVTRTWHPTKMNTLTIESGAGSPEQVEQDKVEDLIRLDGASFLHSVLIGQYAQMFFDLQPATKLALFSEILDLDYWLNMSQEAGHGVRLAEDDACYMSSKMALLEGKLGEAEENLDSYKTQSVEFENDKKDRVEEARAALAVLKQKKQTIDMDIRTIDISVGGVKDAVSHALTAQNREEKTLRGLEEKVSLLRTASQVKKSEIDNIDIELDKFQSVDEICPYCKQPVSAEHLLKEIASLEDRGTVLEDEQQDILQKLEAEEAKVKTLKNKLSHYIDKGRIAEREERGLLDELNEEKRTLTEIVTRLDTQKQTLSQIRTAKNPFKERIRAVRDRVKDLDGQLDELIDKIDLKNNELGALKYWTKGFKEIRLFLIEEALNTLEIEVNNNLIQLGLKDWQISFDVERETKSGGVSKGFQVFINSPNSPDRVPWEAWSGGESQRLLLAGTMGLSNLILNRKGVTCNLEVWDEPSQHLSESGIEDLMDLLYDRARATGKQIWLVDHRSLDYANFASVVTVRKDEKGSHITTLQISGE